MTRSAILEQDEKKILLLKMKYILQQIKHLEDELKSVVKLNQKLSALSFVDSLSILNQTDPEVVKLKLEFNRFTDKNADRSSEDLLEIHSGVKKLVNLQIQRIIAFSEKETPIDKSLIVKTAQAIRKSSKTIIAIESLLNLRGIDDFDKVDFNSANQNIESKIDYINNKENTLNNTIKIIENVSPKGEQSGEYQALINHLKAGGSLDEIESKFHVEQIDIMERQETEEIEQPQPDISSALVKDNIAEAQETIELKTQTTTKSMPPSKPSGLKLFFQIFSKWLNTPTGIGWKLAKQQVLEKYKKN